MSLEWNAFINVKVSKIGSEYVEYMCVAFRNPPVSEMVWKGLLQDLLDMQQSVYTCLKSETCHKVSTSKFTKKYQVYEKLWFNTLKSDIFIAHGTNAYHFYITSPYISWLWQIFVESLLCSSRVENVRLAGQLMHCSMVYWIRLSFTQFYYPTGLSSLNRL